MWPGKPNPDLELLLFKPLGTARPKAARAAGERCDVSTLLAVAASSAVVQNRLTTLLASFSVSGAAEHRGQALLNAIERYVGADTVRQQEFSIAAGDALLESCFCSIDDVSTLDFSHFDTVLGRLARLLGKKDERADSVAGMEPAEYWSLLLSACAPTIDDDGNESQIGERRQDLWLGLVRRSIEVGMAACSPVYRQGAWPTFDRKAGTEPFRAAIADRVGAAAAVIFDAVWAERAMNAHIGVSTKSSVCKPTKRTRFI